MPGFQSTRLVTEGALEPFFFLYTDDSIQGNPETCKQSSIMLNYEVKNIKNLSHCFICGHVHDEIIIECSKEVSVDAISQIMSRTPDWMPDILIRGDGYETKFYKKD